MAHKKKKKGHRKSSKRSRAAKRNYHKSGLAAYNRKRAKHSKKRAKHSKKRRKYHKKPKYTRLSKKDAYAARVARKLAKSHRGRPVAASKPGFTTHQQANLARLRAKAAEAKERYAAWGY